ncbi:MAG TPA: maleylpyruvate isomerase N-terminal domain-containing protein [Anaerolineae bacterium]|nr:maleylpyruvate isomerase N-terminal domain-containing protein [Anaerolineae bacterium]
MSESIDKSQLLDTMRRARAGWDALLASVDEARMTQPGVCGEWSVKDLIAHVAWFEREVVDLLQARALLGSDLWALPPDERNVAIFERNRHRSLNDVRAEAQQVFDTLWQLMESLAEEDLIDPNRFAGMPPDWQPAKLIAENSCEHYPQHIPQIQAWLGKSDSIA